MFDRISCWLSCLSDLAYEMSKTNHLCMSKYRLSYVWHFLSYSSQLHGKNTWLSGPDKMIIQNHRTVTWSDHFTFGRWLSKLSFVVIITPGDPFFKAFMFRWNTSNSKAFQVQTTDWVRISQKCWANMSLSDHNDQKFSFFTMKAT